MDVPQILNKARNGALPSRFIQNMCDENLKIWLQMGLDDINYTTPMTSFSLDTAPQQWETAVLFGCNAVASVIVAGDVAFEDISYNDNGFSLQLDRTGKLMQVNERIRDVFVKMKFNIKKYYSMQSGPCGLGYPRFTAQMSSFMRILYGSGYSR
jgi:hypothetical protein